MSISTRSTYKPVPPRPRRLTDRSRIINIQEQLYGKRVQISEKSLPELKKMISEGRTENVGDITRMLRLVSSVLLSSHLMQTGAFNTVVEAMDSIDIPEDLTDLGIPSVITKSGFTSNVKSIYLPYLMKFVNKRQSFRLPVIPAGVALADVPIEQRLRITDSNNDPNNIKPVYIVSIHPRDRRLVLDITDLTSLGEFMNTGKYTLYPKHRLVVPNFLTVKGNTIVRNMAQPNITHQLINDYIEVNRPIFRGVRQRETARQAVEAQRVEQQQLQAMKQARYRTEEAQRRRRERGVEPFEREFGMPLGEFMGFPEARPEVPFGARDQPELLEALHLQRMRQREAVDAPRRRRRGRLVQRLVDLQTEKDELGLTREGSAEYRRLQRRLGMSEEDILGQMGVHFQEFGGEEEEGEMEEAPLEV